MESKMLYLYLHHRDAPTPRNGLVEYHNTWNTDSELGSIETYDHVVKHCEKARLARTPIRIHRREFNGSPALVCTECKVTSIVPEAETTFRVFFHEHRPLNIPREKYLVKGYYFADPAEDDLLGMLGKIAELEAKIKG